MIEVTIKIDKELPIDDIEGELEAENISLQEKVFVFLAEKEEMELKIKKLEEENIEHKAIIEKLSIFNSPKVEALEKKKKELAEIILILQNKNKTFQWKKFADEMPTEEGFYALHRGSSCIVSSDLKGALRDKNFWENWLFLPKVHKSQKV